MIKIGLEKITDVLGLQGVRLVSKLLLVIAALSFFKVGFITGFLQKEFFELSLLTGNNILGVLLLVIAWMLHKNNM